jgi:dTDP-4-amino-4,6-dideoxygalactose transaminase
MRCVTWLKVTADPASDVYRNRETCRRLSVLISMYTFGKPCDFEILVAVVLDYRLAPVEDAAESLSSPY